MIKKILFFWNPGAGGITADKVDRVLEKLNQAGFDVHCLHTQRRRPTDGLCQAYIDNLAGQDAVLIAGGDGTISNVLNGLGEYLKVPFGIVPFGTVNLLSREIGITSHNFDLPFKNNTKKEVYLGKINELCFTMTASVGFDAKSVDRLDVALKKKIGTLAYIVSLLKTIKSCKDDCYQITCDGQLYSAKSVIIMNGQYYAGSYRLGYQTGIHQPVFQIYLLGRNNFGSILRYCLNMLFQRLHKCADVKVVQGSEINISAHEGGAPVQADGDVYLNLPVHIRSNKHRYEILIP